MPRSATRGGGGEGGSADSVLERPNSQTRCASSSKFCCLCTFAYSASKLVFCAKQRFIFKYFEFGSGSCSLAHFGSGSRVTVCYCHLMVSILKD